MKNFYMTLLSNSSMTYYPQNKSSSFTVQLPRYMFLDGEWEVAMTEIQYPYTFLNVPEDDASFELTTILIDEEFFKWYNDRNIKDRNKLSLQTKTHKLEILPGFYTSVKDIIQSLNKVINDTTQQPSFFEYSAVAHRIGSGNDFIELGRQYIVSCKLRPRLALQLGYPPGHKITDVGEYSPLVPCDGVPDKMLIYCDILEPQVIGDAWGQVLQIINTSSGSFRPYYGQPCSSTFQRSQYIPVQSSHFEKVTIDIRSIDGQLMLFQYGTLCVKLHFQNKR